MRSSSVENKNINELLEKIRVIKAYDLAKSILAIQEWKKNSLSLDESKKWGSFLSCLPLSLSEVIHSFDQMDQDIHQKVENELYENTDGISREWVNKLKQDNIQLYSDDLDNIYSKLKYIFTEILNPYTIEESKIAPRLAVLSNFRLNYLRKVVNYDKTFHIYNKDEAKQLHGIELDLSALGDPRPVVGDLPDEVKEANKKFNASLREQRTKLIKTEKEIKLKNGKYQTSYENCCLNVNTEVEKLKRPLALLDVDNTLVFTKITGKGGIDSINQPLLDSLKMNGVQDIMLFTNMGFGEIEDITAGLSQNKIDRPDLVVELTNQGFRVHAVMTTADVVYDKGIGAAYTEIWLPQYKYIKNYNGEENPINENFLQAKNQFRDCKKHKNPLAYGEKGAMYLYLMQAKPVWLKSIIFVDDAKNNLEDVEKANATIQIPLTTVLISKNSTSDLEPIYTHMQAYYEHNYIAKLY